MYQNWIELVNKFKWVIDKGDITYIFQSKPVISFHTYSFFLHNRCVDTLNY